MTHRQRQLNKQNLQALQQRQGRKCSIWRCSKPTLPVGNLCIRHHKIETRSGSAYNGSITARTRAPFRRSVQHVLKFLLNRHDEATVMMLREMDALLNGLSGYPAQNSLRGLPPKERASALLYHLKRQGSRYRSRPANEGAGLRILIHALAVEIMGRAGKLPCSAPRYLKTQVARPVYGLLRSDVRVYEIESMRRPGVILKNRVVTKKMSLQSKNVVRHLYSMLEPISAGRNRVLSIKRIPEVTVPLPPLEEQRRIVARIESLVAKIDEARGLRQRATEEAERLQFSALSSLMEPHGSIWKRETVGSVIFGMDAGWSPQCDDMPAEAGEWGVLKTTAVQWCEFRPNENKALPASLSPIAALCVQEGDVLVTRAGPRKRVGVVAAVCKTEPRLTISDKLIRLRPDKTKVEPRF